MNALLLAALLVVPARAGAKAPAPGAKTPARWVLAWSDEFDAPAGTLPDPKAWVGERGDNGWGNQELEYYCPPGAGGGPCDPKAPNAVMDGRGRLVVTARKDDKGKWTSARLKSMGLKEFRFGRVEARMKLPHGHGLWPAFWALGADHAKVEWPTCGEIDFMENVPADVPGGLGPDKVKATLHGPGYSGIHGVGKIAALPGGARVDGGFHVYGADWSPGRVAFYVDDRAHPYFVATRADLPKGSAWVFDKPFYLLLNLAVGGSWPKAPAADTPMPATMLVDWVRVYRPAP